jgi:hypothetical protein
MLMTSRAHALLGAVIHLMPELWNGLLTGHPASHQSILSTATKIVFSKSISDHIIPCSVLPKKLSEFAEGDVNLVLPGTTSAGVSLGSLKSRAWSKGLDVFIKECHQTEAG